MKSMSNIIERYEWAEWTKIVNKHSPIHVKFLNSMGTDGLRNIVDIPDIITSQLRIVCKIPVLTYVNDNPTTFYEIDE